MEIEMTQTSGNATLEREPSENIIKENRRKHVYYYLLALACVVAMIGLGLLSWHVLARPNAISTAEMRTQVEHEDETLTLGEYKVCEWTSIDFAASQKILMQIDGIDDGFFDSHEDLLVEGVLCGTKKKVVLAIDADGLRGSIMMDGMTQLVVTPESEEKSKIERVETSVPELTESKLAEEFEAKFLQNKKTTGGRRSANALSPGEVDINLHLEIDSYVADFYNSAYAAARYGIELVAVVNQDIFHDLGFNVKVVSVNVRSTRISEIASPDAYLSELQKIPRPDNANLVHAITTRNIGGGVAFLNGVYWSSQYCYGVSGNFLGNFAEWDKQHLAHEIGHNFGADHTHEMTPPVDTCGLACPDDASNGSIMSYCHSCAGGVANNNYDAGYSIPVRDRILNEYASWKHLLVQTFDCNVELQASGSTLCEREIERIQCGQRLEGSDFDNNGVKVVKFIAPSGLVTVSTCGSDFDTMLSVQTGSIVAASGDDQGNCGYQTVLENLSLTEGEEYFILISGYGGRTGNWMIDVGCDTPPVLEYTPTIGQNEVLVWSDEFDNCSNGLVDESTWGYEEGFSVRNNEDAYYSKSCQEFVFVHDGHCADGWMGPNTNQPSLQACRDECASRNGVGYFAFAEPNTCACYSTDMQCPDDDDYPDHNSYLILFNSCVENGAENARCRDGNLVITAKRETPREEIEWAEYTSASIRTDLGREPKYFGYGRYVMRAKIPTAQGAWPAFWTLGENIRSVGWPRSGEIDIMEYYQGHTLANIMYSNANGKAQWDSTTNDVDPAWADQFHVWEMKWTYDKIVLYLDGVETNSFDTSVADNVEGISNPFHQHHFIILNLAIGGVNGGDPSWTQFPLEYVIDFVRFYEDQTPCGAVQGSSCTNVVSWAHRTGKNRSPGWYSNFEEITGVPLADGTEQDMQLYMYCTGNDNQDCEDTLRLPCSCSAPPCVCPIEPKPQGKSCDVISGYNYFEPIDNIAGQGRTETPDASSCAGRCESVDGCIGSTWWTDGGCHLSGAGSQIIPVGNSGRTIASSCDTCHAVQDFICMEELIWANNNAAANPQWYGSFTEITNVALADATFEDMQRYYFCTQTFPGQCGTSIPAPCTCSSPPCDVCSNQLVTTSTPTSLPTTTVPSRMPTTTVPSLMPTTTEPSLNPTSTCNVIEDSMSGACINEVRWAYQSGKNSNPQWYPMFFEYTGTNIATASEEDMWTYFICKIYNPTKCSTAELPCNRQCEQLCDHTIPTSTCRGEIDWALNFGSRWNPQWYPDFQYITGQPMARATFSDMQRYFKCKNLKPEPWQCGGLQFPCTCSNPPCSTCVASDV